MPTPFQFQEFETTAPSLDLLQSIQEPVIAIDEDMSTWRWANDTAAAERPSTPKTIASSVSEAPTQPIEEAIKAIPSPPKTEPRSIVIGMEPTIINLPNVPSFEPATAAVPVGISTPSKHQEMTETAPLISRFPARANRGVALSPALVATFVEDNNIPDGHVFPPGAEFIKSWKMKNDGLKDWPAATQLSFVGGHRLAAFKDAPITYEVGKVAAGETVDVWAGDLKAPEEPGVYNSFWRLFDSATGHFFGHRLWVTIEVAQPTISTSEEGTAYSNPSLSSSALAMPGAFFTKEQQQEQIEQTTNVPAGTQTNATAASIATPSVSISIESSSVGDDASLVNAGSDDEDDGSEIEIPVMPGALPMASTATLAPPPTATTVTITSGPTVDTVPSVTATPATSASVAVSANRSKSPYSSSDSDSEDEFVVVYDSASEDVA